MVLLFTPEELLKKYVVLSLLHIRKEAGRIDYTVAGISRREVQQQFAALPDAARAALLRFQPEQIIQLLKDTGERVKKQKAGVALPAFLHQSMLRQLHQQFNELKPWFQYLRWYHKLRKPGTSLYQTLPCTFVPERPVLRFSVVEKQGLFSVYTAITINDAGYDSGLFVRNAFFLQKDNRYHLLSFADYQTLEWLQETVGEGLPQALFVEKVLPRLEDGYAVNRNGLLKEKTLHVAPLCRVMLSELNNAFLLLTPQWLYDGVLVEGPFRDKQELTIGGERLLIARHRETEQQFLSLISSFHAAFARQHNGFFYLSFAEAQKKQWFIKTYYKLLEMDVEVAGMDMLHHFRYSPHKIETTLMAVGEKGGRLHLHFTVRFGKETIALTTLQKALNANQRAIVLKDGSLGGLPDEWLSKYATLIKHGKIEEGGLQVSKFLLFGEQEPSVLAPDTQKVWWDQWQQWQNNPEPLYALPATVKATLRPYQQKGFEWLALLSQVGAGACLADDMGLGKTLQTICFLAWYHERHPDQRHLVVCPTSLLYNWQHELQKFAPALRADIFHGSAGYSLSAEAKLIITSYGTLRSHGDWLLAQPFGVAVLDESHNIKNPSAQITRLTQQIEAEVRIALSGTPVVNNTFDLYAQLNFALPGLLGTREFFKREYADAIDRYADEAKMKALQRLTAPFILRRTKEQVATDLPTKTEAVLWCTMGAEQEELYNEIKEQIRGNLFLDIKTNGLQKTKLAVLQGLLKLRQICNHPLLLPSAEHAGRLQSAKTERLLNELQQLSGRHKVLLFSQFSSMLRLLANECDRAGLAYFLLDGQTPADKRMQMVKDFQENAEAPGLFFISLKAGNAGLTLTAADYVFLFDPWWNTAIEQQAVDRTHRIGQTKNVFSYKLVCRNSIEEKILELQQRKKHLAEELITAEEDFVKSLGEEEIAYLFS